MPGFDPAPESGMQSLPSAAAPNSTVTTGSGKGSPAAATGGPSALPKDVGGRGLGIMANTRAPSGRMP